MVVINPWTWGLGRRKTAVARVRLKPGAGGFVVNGRPFDEYFVTIQSRQRAVAPLVSTETNESFDIFCNVNGGGPNGQAEAVSLGVARALTKLSPAHEEILRANSQLTRDGREKERKKYGRRGARRGFQFSKR
ncbi:MAG: small subunit ribosomal protein S9 [Chlamydiales bacterium]|jgi:small subunit ribosomal protein S9